MNNLFKKIKEGTINEALTHGSIFHADDVFSTALITLINPKISVKRAFEVPEGFSGIVTILVWVNMTITKKIRRSERMASHMPHLVSYGES